MTHPTSAPTPGSPSARAAQPAAAQFESAHPTTAQPTTALPTTALLEQLITLAGRSPSPHNTQPWSPHIVAPAALADAVSEADAHADADAAPAASAPAAAPIASPPSLAGPMVEVCVVPSRTLPAGDPSFRDVVLSLGAWVESFAIGAAEHGYDTHVEALPLLSQLEDLPLTGPADRARPVLRVRLEPAGAAESEAGATTPPTGATTTTTASGTTTDPNATNAAPAGAATNATSAATAPGTTGAPTGAGTTAASRR
ncbi:hypothetical protein C5B96_12835 [Subtercola sp. Z020]|uniref:nitroreductase family protein n=1 Tax=Subtercola sp. Z020 TaxID=2080582 RepID=UPI000CE7D462|nr:nitroreductase family protein [Subtercola sp. Z020]PPF79438.1 hypothetical protein C5B96_12835 [Subtercola sp. Z020]